tara:strand:- start:13112 stop:14113 length:1002 start_codon:yes stop_codon:yes gene_type:complete
MIIDSFLFFQELDLLEIRLEYLDPIVDKFIILEANQSFKGSKKDFIFEKNKERYQKYIDKIYYYKILDNHYDFESLMIYLKSSKNVTLNMIMKFMKKHEYYDKDNLSHILDTYHRECLHIPLLDKCEEDDLVIISDLDEIPDFKTIKLLKNGMNNKNTYRLIQHEFQFFLNCYSNSNWKGSIISPYKILKNKSLNNLRRDSPSIKTILNAGYHFTSIGDLKSIRNKIKSWAHQEFNHPLIKRNLAKNIMHGKDIFYRFNKNKNKVLSLNNYDILDQRIIKVIKNYDHLFIKYIQRNHIFNLKYKAYQFIFLFIRFIKNPLKALKKIIKLSLFR